MKKYLGAALGNCVHVGGIVNFFRLVEDEGHETEFLGPAVEIKKLISKIDEYKPDVVAIGYRLTPENIISILDELKEEINKRNLADIEWIFGGTKPVAENAKKFDFFTKIFDGTEDIDEVIRYIRNENNTEEENSFPQTLVERIESKYPYPVLRHHFGQPTIEKTIEGVKKIAESKVLDVISIGPDQNAQQFFYTPEKMESCYDGAGGVPLRTKEDFVDIYNSSRTGNQPLMRCYSGTAEIFKYADMLKDTINNAWCAVPLFWYNVLDGRGDRPLQQSITEGQQLMKWHSERDIPIEVNEAHHWGLRDAHDTIGVAAGFLAAYNAKKMGVKSYIAQYMFNVPSALNNNMDIAKMLAMKTLIEELEDDNFKCYRQVRAGLASLSSDLDLAKGQLAASTYMAMNLDPHIIHVVGFCEAEHVATPEDVIESSKIVRGVIRATLQGRPNVSLDPVIRQRKKELIFEARYLLNYIKNDYSRYEDPWSNPEVLDDIVKRGIFDAPHLTGNVNAKGTIKTRIIDGKCVAYDVENKRAFNEKERINKILEDESSFKNKYGII